MVLPGRVVHPAGVALILGAQLAPGVVGGGQVPGGGDGLGVLLRLGQVDGDVQLPVLRLRLPLHVLGDAVPADIVGVLAEPVVPVCGLLRVLLPQGLELPDDLGGPGGERPHQLGVEQIPVDDGVLLEHPPGIGVVQQGVQHLGQLLLAAGGGFRQGTAVQLQDLQQGVHRPDLLLRLDQLLVQGVGDQLGNGLIPFHAHPSSKPWGWLLCQAQAEATMVFRSLYLGFQPSTWMAFSEEAMS